MPNTLRNTLKNNFAQIPNALIEDSSLSDRCRFLFCYMASRPDKWQFYNAQLASVLGYSVETLRKYMDELVNGGWLIRATNIRDKCNRFSGNQYELLAEKKHTETNGNIEFYDEDESPGDEITPMAGKPVYGKTHHGKTRVLNNTDYQQYESKQKEIEDFNLKKNTKEKKPEEAKTHPPTPKGEISSHKNPSDLFFDINQDDERRDEKIKSDLNQNRDAPTNPPNQPKKTRRKSRDAFVPPTFEEVACYVLELDSKVDPHAFMDKYEENGWRVGQGRGNPMKDWKAAVRFWDRNQRKWSGEDRFIEPSLSDVRAYIEETGSRVNPERFIAHYNAVDWTVNGSKILNWKGFVDKWGVNQTAPKVSDNSIIADGIRLADKIFGKEAEPEAEVKEKSIFGETLLIMPT